MNILLGLNNPAVGGARTHVLALAEGLLRRGHRALLVTDPGFLEEEMRARGIPFRARADGDREMLDLLLSLVERECPAILHAHHGETDREGYLVWQATGLPFVVTVHGLMLWHLEDRHIAEAARAVIAVSETVAEFIHQRAPALRGKVVVIPNGIDTDEFRPRPDADALRAQAGLAPDERVVMYAGRIAAEKSPAVFAAMEAVRDLAGRGVRIRGLCVGRTDAYVHQRVVDLAHETNSDAGREILRLTGLRRDMPEMLALADVVVAAGRSALEAMAVGKPVVAWGCAGYLGPVTPDNWSTALAANFGDHRGGPGPSPGELADLVDCLLADPDNRGTDLRDLVIRDCGLDRIAARHEAVYGGPTGG